MAEALASPTAVVRCAGPSDAAALAALDVPGMATAQVWRETLTRPHASAWLWCENGVPRGALLASRTLDEAEVHQLWVTPGQRRRGGADRLLACALDELRRAGAGVVYLEVRASNAAAIGCYAKHGFVATGRRPRYYPGAPREDAVAMTRVLAP